LVFKSLSILKDSFMEWILWDFLVESINTTLFQQSHSKPWDCSYSRQDFFLLEIYYVLSMFLLRMRVKRKTEDLVLYNFLCLIGNKLFLSTIIDDFVIQIQIRLFKNQIAILFIHTLFDQFYVIYFEWQSIIHKLELFRIYEYTCQLHWLRFVFLFFLFNDFNWLYYIFALQQPITIWQKNIEKTKLCSHFMCFG
jgi:hypothetical protein